MTKLFADPLKIIILPLLLTLAVHDVFGQSTLLSKKVTLTVTDLPLSAVLKTLGETFNIKFSYDPAVINAGRKVSFRVTNQSLDILLSKILENPALSFREIGNQVVIYADPSRLNPEITPEQVIKPPADTRILPVVPDTVVVIRTDTVHLLRTDTIIQLQTVVKHDTIVRTDTIYKYRTQKAGRKNTPDLTRNNISRRNFRQGNGLYTGLFYEQNITGKPVFEAVTSLGNGNIASLDSAHSASSINFTTGFTLGYDYYSFGIRSGIAYERLGETFEYSFYEQTGGYYLKDTVETYFTVAGTDTAWFYITDSTYINKDYQQYTYKNPNVCRYLEVPLMLRFRIYRGEMTSLYIIGGGTGSFRIGSKALFMKPGDAHQIRWASNADFKPLVFSWSVGAGADFRLSDNLSFFVESSYKKMLGSQLTDGDVNKIFRGLNLRTGLFVRIY